MIDSFYSKIVIGLSLVIKQILLSCFEDFKDKDICLFRKVFTWFPIWFLFGSSRLLVAHMHTKNKYEYLYAH